MKNWFILRIFLFILTFIFSPYLTSALIPQPYTTIKKVPYCFNPEHKSIELAHNIMALATPEKIELFDTESKKVLLECINDKTGMPHICMALNKDKPKLAYLTGRTEFYEATEKIALPEDEKSCITICEMATGKILFSKKCRSGSNGLAFHPTDDNYIISYASSLGYNELLKDDQKINLLQIHPLNDAHSEYTIELKSNIQGYNNLVYFTTNTLVSHPEKNELLVMINDVWHALSHFFISREKMFLIKIALETMAPVKDVSNKIIMLIRNSGSIEKKEDFSSKCLHVKKSFFYNYGATKRRTDYKMAGYSYDGRYIALVCDLFNTIVLHDTVFNQRKIFTKTYNTIRAIGFHPNKNIIAIIIDSNRNWDHGNNIIYCDIKTGKIVPVSSYLPLDFTLEMSSKCDTDNLTSSFLIRQLIFNEDGSKAYVVDDNELKCFDIPQEIIDFKEQEPINQQPILQPIQAKESKAIQPDSIEIIPTINEPTMPTLISHSLHNKKPSLCTLFIRHSRIIALLGFGSIIGAWLLYYYSFLSLPIDQ